MRRTPKMFENKMTSKFCRTAFQQPQRSQPAVAHVLAVKSRREVVCVHQYTVQLVKESW